MSTQLSFFRHIGNVSLLTLLSRIAGFIRDIMLASIFGNSLASDAFLFAYRFPAMLRTLLIEEGFQAAFVPIYIQLNQNNRQQAQQFAGGVLLAMLVLAVALLVPSLIYMPELMGLLAPEFKQRADSFPLLVLLARILFCYFAFLLVSAVFVNLLQAHKKFAMAASLPLFVSTMLIATLFFVGQFPDHPWLNYPPNSIVWLAIAVLSAGLLQTICIVGVALKHQLGVRFYMNRKVFASLMRFFGKMLPVMLGKSSVQISFLINQILIIGTSAGALSVFYYAERMIHLPIGIFVIAIATVLLPYLSHQLQQAQLEEKILAQHQAVTAALLLTVPAMCAFIILAPLIMLTLFQRGAFSIEAALASAQILILLSPGLPAIAMIKIQTTILFAHSDTMTPFLVTIISAIINIILAITLIDYFGFLGVAIASSITLGLQAIMLGLILLKKRLYLFDRTIMLNIVKIIIACLLMSMTLYLTLPSTARLIEYGFSQRFFALCWLILLGGIIYIVAVLMLRILRLNDIRQLLTAKKNMT